MKKFILFLFLAFPVAAGATQHKPDVYIFTAPTCMHCMVCKKECLPDLKSEFAGKVNFIELDTSVEANSLKLVDLAEKYGKKPAVPALVVGDYFLMGYPNQIGLHAREAIERTIAARVDTREVEDIDSKEAFKNFTVAAILFNAAVDSINPCAFAVIIFFVSFLSVYGYTKKEIVYVGSAYCLAVFITYLLLGLGIFNVLYAFEGFYYVTKVFYLLTAALCFIFFGLSIYDIIVYSKTKNSKAVLLRLPDNLKLRINKVIGFFLRDKEKSATRLIAASLAVGFLVSIVEAVCTGQIYLPTIALIMKDPSLRLQATFYLLIYNIVFILPLVGVFLLVLAGYKSEGLNNFLKKNLVLVKMLVALVFLGLGLMLVFS